MYAKLFCYVFVIKLRIYITKVATMQFPNRNYSELRANMKVIIRKFMYVIIVRNVAKHYKMITLILPVKLFSLCSSVGSQMLSLVEFSLDSTKHDKNVFRKIAHVLLYSTFLTFKLSLVIENVHEVQKEKKYNDEKLLLFFHIFSMFFGVVSGLRNRKSVDLIKFYSQLGLRIRIMLCMLIM